MVPCLVSCVLVGRWLVLSLCGVCGGVCVVMCVI